MRSVKSAASSARRRRRFATTSPSANSATKTAAAALMLAIAALAYGTAPAASGYRNTVTMDVAGAPVIVLTSLNGDVHLNAANTNRVHIVAQLHGESQKNLDQMSV